MITFEEINFKMKKHFSAIFLSVSLLGFSQIRESKLDSLIQNTIKTFDVPGISVGVVKDGNLIYAKGFGQSSLTSKQKMDESTLVGIASNSKGFTCTALAILADEGKLSFDDKVTKYLPEFKMYDDYVTREMTIKDLVTHRAGLGLGQGDLMFFPEGGNLSPDVIIKRVQYLKPEHSFRYAMDYNNIMFIVAGEIIHRISGQTWAEFIEDRIMKPVGMTGSFGSYARAKKAGVKNIIDAHAPVSGKAVQVPHDWSESANAAGGIVSNIKDISLWADFLMNGFTTKSGKKLVSDKQIQQLWQIQQPIPVALKNPYDTHFYGYGMGWFLSDVKGHFQVQHTGGLIGTVTQFTLIPDMKLGIIVLTNQQQGTAFNTITNTIKDSYLGIPERNWLKTYGERYAKGNADYSKQKMDAYQAAELFGKKSQLNFSQISGVFSDPWFGDVEISQKGKKLRIESKTSPRLKGDLIPYSENTFIAKWDDRSYDADAFVTFKLENGKAVSAKLKPISDVTDFSFDFEDLDLERK